MRRTPWPRALLALLLLLVLGATASCGARQRGDSPPDDEFVRNTRSAFPELEDEVTWPQEQVVYYATDRTPLDPDFLWYLKRFLWAALALVLGRVVLRSMRKIVAPPYQWRVTLGNWILGIGVAVLAVYAGWQCLRTATLHGRVGLVYGGERAHLSGEGRLPLHLGMLTVSIPEVHREGAIERPSLFRGDLIEDPDEHMVLTGTWQLDDGAFFERIRTKVGWYEAGAEGTDAYEAGSDHDIFVFVHGYNCTFEDAALRAAQIAWDLGFVGAPILYSWPSAGSVPEYLADGANVAWSVAHLHAFLTRLQAEAPGTPIHLVAHSMGNRALTEALRRIRQDQRAEEHPDNPFEEVVLAAPDIDADTFRDDVGPAILSPGSRISLYASENDMALVASREFHGAPRAGEAGDAIVVIPGIETIDVSAVTGSHSYIGDNGRVLGDLAAVFRRYARPIESPDDDVRQVRRTRGSLEWWALEEVEEGSE